MMAASRCRAQEPMPASCADNGGFYVDSGCANRVASWGRSRVGIPAVRAENGFVARLKQAGDGLRRFDLVPKGA